LCGTGHRPADVDVPGGPGLSARGGFPLAAGPSRDRSGRAEPEERHEVGDRLGDGHAPGGDPPVVAFEPGEAGSEMVAAPASEGLLMRRSTAGSRSGPSTTSAWLASRSRGESPPGAVLLHAPSTAFQAPGGGENQLVQTARHLEALEVPI